MTNLLTRIYSFYKGAFRRSVATSTGRHLWLLLLVKVAVLLILFKILFFPDRLASLPSEEAKADAVRTALTQTNKP